MITAEEVHPETNVRNGEDTIMQTQNTHVDADSNSHSGFFTRAGEVVKTTAGNTKVRVIAGCLLLGAGLAWGAVKLYQMANEPDEQV